MLSKSKEKFLREKPHCNIGTIGHIDHGKTTLTAAITKYLSRHVANNQFKSYWLIDKHAEERKRGITISASHVEYQTEVRHYTHIDCPGHQNYIKNMITGATQMDGVILVVALTEGPQEQTREHIILSKEVGIPYMIVYANKLDAVKELELVEFVELEIRELVAAYSYPFELPVVKGSAKRALSEEAEDETDLGCGSIRELLEFVDSYIQQPKRPDDAPFLMSIEEVYSISGRGTVVTGKVEKGSLVVGSEVEIIGAKYFKTVCTGLEMYNKYLEIAMAGENVGALVRGVRKEEVKRGFAMIQPGTMFASKKFQAKAYFLTAKEGGRHKPFYTNYKPQFFFRTANVTGSLILPEDVFVAMPGDTITFDVELLENAALNEGLRFAMREGTVTLGAGIILKTFLEE